MTTNYPEPQARSRLPEIVQLVLAAVAAIAIAVAVQGWPESASPCHATSCDDV